MQKVATLYLSRNVNVKAKLLVTQIAVLFMERPFNIGGGMGVMKIGGEEGTCFGP